MADLILSAQDGWEQVSPEGIQRAITAYGDFNNVKLAIGTGNLGEVSIVIDENKFPEPYTAVESVFVGESLWIKSVLTSTLQG